MSDSRRALITFAFLSEALRTHHDVVVGLAPLFNPIATDFAGQMFDPNKLAVELQSRYGLLVTSDVAEFISFRLHSAGLLKRTAPGSHDVTFFWVAPPSTSPASNLTIDERIDLVAKLALEFAAKHPNLMTWTLAEDTVLDLIFDWIIDQDQEVRAAEAAYDATLQQNPVAARAGRRRLLSEQEYFCTRFLKWLEDVDPSTFATIAELGNALLVAEVILELNEPSVSPQAGALQVYLDSPYCMDLIGCSGRARKEEAAYVIDCFRRYKTIISVFSHSVEEIQENIRALLSNQPNDRRGPSATALARGEVSEDFLLSVARNPHQHLEQHAVQVFNVETTPLPTNSLQVFTEDARLNLLSKLHPHYNRLEAAERDAMSAAIIMRRRNRHKSNDLFRTRHFMITRNPMVATITKTYCRDNGFIQNEHLGPFVLASQAAAVIWLAVGSPQKADISRRKLVANCSKAAESAPKIIDSLRRKLREISPENIEQFDALIKEPRNLQLALDFTQGSDTRVVNVDVERLLSEMKSELVAKEQADSRRAQSKIRKAFREKVRQKDEEVGKLTEQVGALEQEVAAGRKGRETAFQSIFASNCRLCKSVVMAIKIVSALLISLCAFATSSIFLDPLDKAWFPYWTLGISIFVAFLAGVVLFVDPRHFIELRTTRYFQRRFDRRINEAALDEVRQSYMLDWRNCSTRKTVNESPGNETLV